MSDFACGANKTGFHLMSVNWDRDVKGYEVFDIRNVVEGDPSPRWSRHFTPASRY